jgi:hypothetical protein
MSITYGAGSATKVLYLHLSIGEYSGDINVLNIPLSGLYTQLWSTTKSRGTIMPESDEIWHYQGALTKT